MFTPSLNVTNFYTGVGRLHTMLQNISQLTIALAFGRRFEEYFARGVEE